jgi:hypothetical protein
MLRLKTPAPPLQLTPDHAASHGSPDPQPVEMVHELPPVAWYNSTSAARCTASVVATAAA